MCDPLRNGKCLISPTRILRLRGFRRVDLWRVLSKVFESYHRVSEKPQNSLLKTENQARVQR